MRGTGSDTDMVLCLENESLDLVNLCADLVRMDYSA
jgi:hypothetical protein